MITVLLVEDELSIAEALRDILEDEGFHVHLATDGRRGLADALARRPDLILTDVMMPNMSGLELVENLRSTPELADIPVVMMSAGWQEAWRAARPDAILQKPFHVDQLLDVVRRVLQK